MLTSVEKKKKKFYPLIQFHTLFFHSLGGLNFFFLVNQEA